MSVTRRCKPLQHNDRRHRWKVLGVGVSPTPSFPAAFPAFRQAAA